MSEFLPASDRAQLQTPTSQSVLQPQRGPIILVLGILALTTIPFLGAIAWALGQKDLRRMKQGLMDPSGKDLTFVGKILGTVATFKDGFLLSLVLGALLSHTWDSLGMIVAALPLLIIIEVALTIILVMEIRSKSKG
jgi:hypothetical protein